MIQSLPKWDGDVEKGVLWVRATQKIVSANRDCAEKSSGDCAESQQESARTWLEIRQTRRSFAVQLNISSSNCRQVRFGGEQIDQVEALGVFGQDRREHAEDNVSRFGSHE
jgi:hypothetical protein